MYPGKQEVQVLPVQVEQPGGQWLRQVERSEES